MGGAFTGVADSLDAVYWNPAGLSQIGAFEVNSTLVTNWHYSNYDIYIAAGSPVKSGGLGIAFVYNKDHIMKLVSEDGRELGWLAHDTNYLQLSYGAYLIEDLNLAVGLSGKFIWSSLEANINSGIDETLDDTSTVDLDAGIHWSFGPKVGMRTYRMFSMPEHKMFSIGCLVQNFLESELKFKKEGIILKHVENIRPGFSFRPDELSIISLELYDITTQYFDEPQIRFGLERWFGFGKGKKIMALRAGGYHVNNQENLKAYTFGLGWKFDNKVELAYTMLHWKEDNENTYFITMNYW
ncbi:MAG: type IX secretion system membrane protein PorP/SprF [bacterium]